jgi:hypothetical protein
MEAAGMAGAGMAVVGKAAAIIGIEAPIVVQLTGT